MNEKNQCFECVNRIPGCHSSCPAYAEYKSKMQKQKDKFREDHRGHHELNQMALDRKYYNVKFRIKHRGG